LYGDLPSSAESSALARSSTPGVPLELLLQSVGDAPDVGLRAAEVAGHEDHSVVAGAAGLDRGDVERAEVTHVVGDDRPLRRPSEVEDLGV